jgi:signal transduction histidine kinase
MRVDSRDGRAVLRITNSGPVVPAAEIDRLLTPFQRMAPDRLGHPSGFGLGLSIVAAIAAAHDATLDIAPGDSGGLRVEVNFAALADVTLLALEPGDAEFVSQSR